MPIACLFPCMLALYRHGSKWPWWVCFLMQLESMGHSHRTRLLSRSAFTPRSTTSAVLLPWTYTLLHLLTTVASPYFFDDICVCCPCDSELLSLPYGLLACFWDHCDKRGWSWKETPTVNWLQEWTNEWRRAEMLKGSHDEGSKHLQSPTWGGYKEELACSTHPFNVSLIDCTTCLKESSWEMTATCLLG